MTATKKAAKVCTDRQDVTTSLQPASDTGTSRKRQCILTMACQNGFLPFTSSWPHIWIAVFISHAHIIVLSRCAMLHNTAVDVHAMLTELLRDPMLCTPCWCAVTSSAAMLLQPHAHPDPRTKQLPAHARLTASVRYPRPLPA